MKRLKETTIKRYDANQLSNHLDRLLNAFEAGTAPYRCDRYAIWEHHQEFNIYGFYCQYDDRDAIIDAINDVYKQLGI